jgi:hypothetical protein
MSVEKAEIQVANVPEGRVVTPLSPSLKYILPIPLLLFPKPLP